jgi:AcrR family transcriptional regulator
MDTTGRRPKARRGQGAELREEILDAATALITETGDAATLSLRAIARRVGVATTSLYLHFPDLDALVDEVKHRQFAAFAETLDSAADEAGRDPHRRLRARANAYLDYGTAHPGLYRVLFARRDPARLRPGRHPDAFLGAASFAGLRADAVLLAGDPREGVLVASHLWAALHGLVTLLGADLEFPWAVVAPDLHRHVDDLVDRLLAAPDPRTDPGARCR